MLFRSLLQSEKGNLFRSDARWRGALAGEGGRGGRAALGMAHSLGGPSHPVTTPRRPIPRKWSRGSLRLRYSCASPAFGGRQGPVGHCPAANRGREPGSTALLRRGGGQEYHCTDTLFFAAQHCLPCRNARMCLRNPAARMARGDCHLSMLRQGSQQYCRSRADSVAARTKPPRLKSHP